MEHHDAHRLMCIHRLQLAHSRDRSFRYGHEIGPCRAAWDADPVTFPQAIDRRLNIPVIEANPVLVRAGAGLGEHRSRHLHAGVEREGSRRQR